MMSAFDTKTKSTGINATNAVSLTITDNSSITMKNVDIGIGMSGGRLLIIHCRIQRRSRPKIRPRSGEQAGIPKGR